MIADEMIFHNRYSYNFAYLMDDMGGFIECLILTIGVLTHQINKYDFEIQLLSKLYKTKLKPKNS